MLNKIKKFLNNKLILATIVLIIGLGSIYFLGADNVIEEFSEEIIKEEVGINVDLSPQSPESIINSENK